MPSPQQPLRRYVRYPLHLPVSVRLDDKEIRTQSENISVKGILLSCASHIPEGSAVELAITVGSVELICGIMIALNFGVRFFAILMIIFIALVTFYFHDFWNQPAPENARTLIDALKNLSIIGALFMIAGYGRGPRPNEPSYADM